VCRKRRKRDSKRNYKTLQLRKWTRRASSKFLQQIQKLAQKIVSHCRWILSTDHCWYSSNRNLKIM
jgi:hypothetical protein